MDEPILVPMPWRAAVRLAGRDAVRWLQGMCTNDVAKLPRGSGGCLAAMANRQGKIMAVMTALVRAEDVVIETDQGCLPAIREAAARFIVSEDCRLEDESEVWTVMAVYGGKAAGRAPYGFEARAEALAFADPELGVPGARWIVPAGRADELEMELVAGGARLADEAEYEELRVRHGTPRWGADFDATCLPMEAGLERAAVSYTKGCYLGQEVILRVRNFGELPRRLRHLQFEGTMGPFDKVLLHGKEVGQVTSSVQGCAIARLAKGAYEPGTEVAVVGRGEVTAAKVAALPFEEA